MMEDKVQLSNYNQPDKYCVFIPWTTMGGLTENRYVGTFVWQAVSPILEKKALAQVREAAKTDFAARGTVEAAAERSQASSPAAPSSCTESDFRSMFTFRPLSITWRFSSRIPNSFWILGTISIFFFIQFFGVALSWRTNCQPCADRAQRT